MVCIENTATKVLIGIQGGTGAVIGDVDGRNISGEVIVYSSSFYYSILGHVVVEVNIG